MGEQWVYVGRTGEESVRSRGSLYTLQRDKGSKRVDGAIYLRTSLVSMSEHVRS